jgi:carbamoyl-phosphate synthase small subunit
MTTSTARLALENGSVFYGEAFGDLTPKTIDGEVCFNTSMTGYQEILTDPSYAGQIVSMTYPLIGNYGVNDDDDESRGIFVRGFVVRELSNMASNHSATKSLELWLAEHGITGITGIDTRTLTRTLRTTGALNGVISTEALSDSQLVQRAQAAPGLVDINLVKDVSIAEPITWSQGLNNWTPRQDQASEQQCEACRVVAIDCGIKRNILRHLVDSGCEVTVVPFDATPQQVLAYRPDGVFVSNGPGDPDPVTATIDCLRQLKGQVPIFGICLGLQLLGLAIGARRFKLKFGHRGANQPVQNLATSKVEITSQNHGFGIDLDSLKAVGAEPTHINLNDQTLEGFRHPQMPIFAVQYHPEASPGPHDARYLFDCFMSMMQTGQSPSGEQMHQAQCRRNQVATST